MMQQGAGSSRLHLKYTFCVSDNRRTWLICSEIAFINKGGTQFPICRIPFSYSPANANHPEIAVNAPDGVGGFPWIKSDGIESVAGDVLLRSADSDLIPMPVCLVFLSSRQQFLHLIRWRLTTGKRIAA
jgi:hypothetical protein